MGLYIETKFSYYTESKNNDLFKNKYNMYFTNNKLNEEKIDFSL